MFVIIDHFMDNSMNINDFDRYRTLRARIAAGLPTAGNITPNPAFRPIAVCTRHAMGRAGLTYCPKALEFGLAPVPG